MEKLKGALERFPEDFRTLLFNYFTVSIEEKVELIAKEEILKIWDISKKVTEGLRKQKERFARLEKSFAETKQGKKEA